MAELKMKIPLSSVLINKVNFDIMLEEDLPVFCVNQKVRKKRFLSFSFLNNNRKNFWLYKGDVEFFLTEESFLKLKERAIAKTGKWDIEWNQKTEKDVPTKPAAPEKNKEPDTELGYGNEYNAIVKLSAEEKVKKLLKAQGELYRLMNEKKPDRNKTTKAFVDASKATTLINFVTLEEVVELADEEAKKHTQKMVNITGEMVKSSVRLIERDVLSNELMNTLVKQSNGTIIQHITRVYLNSIAYLAYYNTLFTTGAIQKIRASFTKYRIFYHSLLPHIKNDEINLERVFYGGMKPIPPELFSNWAIGFLLHDIGKANAIEYHEGEKRYDRDIVMAHVTTGYKSLTTKTNYPIEARLITGFHHEYYGDPDGYGYYRTSLQQYKKLKPDTEQNYCIAYEHKPVLEYKALAYFPAKVLEIIDVYDSLTDQNRVYRKGMSTEEALEYMRQNFILKKLKLDIILFDIFSDFIRKKQKPNSRK